MYWELNVEVIFFNMTTWMPKFENHKNPCCVQRKIVAPNSSSTWSQFLKIQLCNDLFGILTFFPHKWRFFFTMTFYIWKYLCQPSLQQKGSENCSVDEVVGMQLHTLNWTKSGQMYPHGLSHGVRCPSSTNMTYCGQKKLMRTRCLSDWRPVIDF